MLGASLDRAGKDQPELVALAADAASIFSNAPWLPLALTDRVHVGGSRGWATVADVLEQAVSGRTPTTRGEGRRGSLEDVCLVVLATLCLLVQRHPVAGAVRGRQPSSGAAESPAATRRALDTDTFLFLQQVAGVLTILGGARLAVGHPSVNEAECVSCLETIRGLFLGRSGEDSGAGAATGGNSEAGTAGLGGRGPGDCVLGHLAAALAEEGARQGPRFGRTSAGASAAGATAAHDATSAVEGRDERIGAAEQQASSPLPPLAIKAALSAAAAVRDRLAIRARVEAGRRISATS